MSVLNNRTMNMIARGVLQKVDDTSGVQVNALTILDGERKDNIERFQNYGFTGVPTGDAEAVVIFPGGDRSAGVIVALDERGTRMTGLNPGEVAVYTNEGDSIVLGVNNEITITTKRLIVQAAETVTVDAPQGVRITSAQPVLVQTPNLRVEGSITATGTINQGVP